MSLDGKPLLQVRRGSDPTSTSTKGTPSVEVVKDDDEEVTETKIIGVTETGVIRKRSFKRKMTKEEREERAKRYGQDKAEYQKIVDRIMGERLVSGTMEGLQERWKMLSFMYDDCMEMVSQWENKRASRLKAQWMWNIQVGLMTAGGVVVLLFFLWSAIRAIW